VRSSTVNRRTRNRLIAAVAATALVGGSALVAGAPAFAAPEPVEGAAGAFGAFGQLQADIGDLTIPLSSGQVGSIEVEGTGEDFSADGPTTILDLLIGDITVAGSETAVQSNQNVAQAHSAITDVSANLFGLPVVGLTSAEANVTCPVGGDTGAEIDLGSLTIFGIPVTQSDFPYTDSQQLPTSVLLSDDPGATPVDLSDLSLDVTVDQIVENDDAGAVGISLAASLTISGTLAGEPASLTGLLILSSALCVTPVPADLAATAITPTSGPTAGGNTVTITGAGFTSGTTVTFGSAAATNVVVSPDGTSLTAVVPAGAAGATTVTVSRPELGPAVPAASVTLAYTYVAPVVPIIPAANVTPASTLAATGLDPMPLAVGSAGVLALGVLALIGTARLRRRTA